jgi:hypothetical protein
MGVIGTMTFAGMLALCAAAVGLQADEGFLKGAAASSSREVETVDGSKAGIKSFKDSSDVRLPDEVRLRNGVSPFARLDGPTFSAGVDLLFMVPRFESNPAFSVTSSSIVGPQSPVLTVQRFHEFEYDYSVTPRLWLGAQLAGGLGARIRWMHFDQSAPVRSYINEPLQLFGAGVYRSVSSTSPLLSIGPQTTLPAVNSIQTQNPLAVVDRIDVHSDLVYDLWDFEATFSDLRSGAWSVELFGGMRYAHLNQHYNAFGGPAIRQELLSAQSFNGAGPTFGLEGRRELGVPGLTFRGNGRVSMLFGEDEHRLRGASVGLTPPFAVTDYDAAAERTRILPIIDMELGLRYVRPLGRFLWRIDGGVISQLVPAGSGANGNGNMGFIGFNLGTGVTF